MLLLAITTAGLAFIKGEAINQTYELPTANDPVLITWATAETIPEPVLPEPVEEIVDAGRSDAVEQHIQGSVEQTLAIEKPAVTSEPTYAREPAAINSDRNLGEESIRELICFYDWDCEEALGVVFGNARCPNGESTGNPWAYNHGNYGLFQINAVHSARVGGDLSRLFDAATNVAVAYAIYSDHGGWGPWACKP